MKFTVLLPTFDNGAVIRSAIDSVLEQSCGDFELFVVCDGSPAETHAIVDAYATRDKRICAFKFEKGERHGEAWRHRALDSATGEAVCYISDDDFWFPDHLAAMGELLAEADFAHTRHVEIAPDFTVAGFVGDLGDVAMRERMLTQKTNFFGLSVAGHRMDAYRRLPEGWAPAPEEIWTDLHMWRKWLAAPGMRLRSSMAVTTLHLPRTHATHRTGATGCNEVAYWREAFRDPSMHAALIDLIPSNMQKIGLAKIAAHAAALRAAKSDAQLEQVRSKAQAESAQVAADARAREDELLNQVAARETELHAVLNSRIWRYTRPWRDFRKWLSGSAR